MDFNKNNRRPEIMAPVGSPESLAAALRAGADSIYFGIGRLNMRSHSASPFTIDDLHRIARECRACGVKSYLTLNTIIYDNDLDEMRRMVDAARAAQISAVIASDVAVMTYCRQVGQEVHLSTQLNISNIEALRFYAQFADVVVLARELKLEQVAEIHRAIRRDNICGPSGQPVRIEMFCHGALCMAVSGKCYLSLDNAGRSANRGECLQLCRRGYSVTDIETGTELNIDNRYIMSPRDLKTIGFIDKMLQAGVSVFKIEGRARGADYVDTVVRCYREALESVSDGTFDDEAKHRDWDERLGRVFNRGFWDGYYLGQRLGEWTRGGGSSATERKTYCGKGVRYYSRLGVAEFKIEACKLHKGDRILVTGPTTGALYATVEEIRYDLQPVDTAQKGWHVSIPVATKIRRNDKLFVITERNEGDKERYPSSPQ